MGLKKINKSSLKFICAISISLFSLCACFMATLAWFTSVKIQQMAGDDFGIDKGSQLKAQSCYAIQWDDDNNIAKSTKIEKDENGNWPSITMSDYDSVLTDRNENTALFFRLEISKYDTSRDLSIVVPCTAPYKNANNKILNKLSNVILVRCFTRLYQNSSVVKDTYQLDESNQNFQSNISAIYSGMKDRVKNDNTIPTASFVTKVNNVSTKANSVTLTLSKSVVYAANNISNDATYSNGEDYVVVYLSFDYCTTDGNDLVNEYITNNNESGSDADLDDKHYFESDIGSIKILDGE